MTIGDARLLTADQLYSDVERTTCGAVHEKVYRSTVKEDIGAINHLPSWTPIVRSWCIARWLHRRRMRVKRLNGPTTNMDEQHACTCWSECSNHFELQFCVTIIYYILV